MRTFARVVRGEMTPPTVAGYLTSTALSLAALRSLETGSEVRLADVAAS